MHELALAQEVLLRVSERAQHERARKVLEVSLRVGRLSLVVPASFRFYFDLCKEETLAAGAELLIEQVPGCARCRTCDRVFEPDAPLELCPAGHTDIQWISGFELEITSMRIDDAEEKPCAGPAAVGGRRST